MNQRRLSHLVLLIPLLFHLQAGAAPAVHAQGGGLVLAFYYAWYDEKTWTNGQVPDMPLSPYRSADRTTIERHVREARGAGIDALIQSWYGPGDNPTEQNLVTLLDVAQTQGFKATVDFETVSPYMPGLDALVGGLKHLIAVHARHPAFLRYDNKPVIFFWREQRLSLQTWASIRQEVDPDHNTLWIADGDDPAWLDVFDGLHLYNITWKVNTNPEYTASKMRKRIDEYKAKQGVQRYWVATAMPGYDDTHIAGQADPYTYPRSPEYYRRTWAAATASQPEMIVITSYNEWREGTMIEPSVTYGSAYLDLTRELAAQYKSSAPAVDASPTPTATSLPPTPTPTWTMTLSPTPTATATPTPTPSPTGTPTSTPTLTLTPTPTATSTPTPPATLSPTASPSPSATPSATPSPTASPTRTLVATEEPVPFDTQTPLPTIRPGSGPSTPALPCAGTGVLLFGLIGLLSFKTRLRA